MELAAALGVLAAPSVTMISPSPATDAELETVHDEDYVAAVRQAGRTLAPDLRFGLGTSTTRSSRACTRRPRWSSGATLAAATGPVWSGDRARTR